jgi:hypothetical protein
MTQPDSPLSRLPKKQDDPAERMRTILTAAQEDGDSPGTPPARPEPQADPALGRKSRPKPQRFEQDQGEKSSRLSFRKDKILPAFWTVASVISMTVNVILLIVVLVLLRNLPALPDTAPDPVLLLGGLYDNFEAMDQAHIRTNIPVDAQVPVNFDLQLDSQTTVTLSQDVVVSGAFVRINTPLININAPANVTLPAGTSLPINLKLTVPVQTMISIHLDVPVDIALSQTDLHEPFVGLREIVRPFYCMVKPDALSTAGASVCK